MAIQGAIDAGCGTGELCSYISQQPGVASVVGFDLSPDFISYARTNNSSPNVRYHVADAADPSTIKPEWRGAFSKVVSTFVLHWVKDKPTALNMLNSCLKPGGEIVFLCVSDKSKFHEKYPHCYISRDQVRGVIRPTLPHLSYLPEDKQEEFVDELIKMAEKRHWITGEEAPTVHEVLGVHGYSRSKDMSFKTQPTAVSF
ncbi:biotin biosynthesis bifunctional protein BioCD-like [Branchiostoma floridae]|uniref:Biotin biosynthesis bifunctional protein BioCD-like n=1 Tax=Branchiostoma floridae TaxID=7739 RepID=A0A9J7L8L9_BRAFL|nr:biotin biosynthesis bifunctional protein BioCD-like [Branchiostoma floridae]